jgi:hybrid cluster-associated redox disulfide protein
MSETITKEMNLKELLRKYPDSARIFASYGIGCLGCALANYETIEEGISAHGLNVEDFVKDLNAYVDNKN